MKKLLIVLAMIAAFNTGAQVVPFVSTTLTPGSGDFIVDKSHYPFDAVVLYILSSDTSKVGLNYTMTGSSLVAMKPRVKYIDGRTGQPFVSVTRLQQFYDSFMVSPPFTTTLNSATLNFSGDATAANQVLQIARLDSIAKWTSNEGVTVTHVAAGDSVHVLAGYIAIGGIKDATGAFLVLADVTGTTAVEKGFISAGTTTPVIPMQSYKAAATAHYVTAVNACNVFVLKLH